MSSVKMEEEAEKPEEPCLTYTTHQATFDAKQCRTRGKRMTARALLRACERVLWGFTMEAPQDVSCDDYAASVMPGLNVVHPYDIVFVEQVLYGCCRYAKLLGVLVSKLYKCKAGSTYMEDSFLFTALGYLALIRLDELTFPNFCRLVLSQHAQKLLPFVEFVFNAEYLNKECKPEWLKAYDIEFVQELIGNIISWSAEAAALGTSLSDRVFYKDPRTGRKIVAQPFVLSICPRPKPEPKEEEPPVPFKAKPRPKFKATPTPRQRAVEQAFAENRKRQADFYAQPNNRPFRLRTLERPSHFEEIKQEVEKRRQLEYEYQPPKASKCPDPPTNEIKLTVAAVLREHSLYQKQIDADKRRIEAFETELRDDASFKAWQHEERARVETGKALECKFRRESVLAIAQAIHEAKETIAKEKREFAVDVRAEAQVLMTRREEFDMNVELFNKLRRENVLHQQVALKESLSKLAETKKIRAQEIHEKSAEFNAELAYNHALELKIKQELVAQLRAAEMEAVRTLEKFDPNSVAGHGLLAEMSIAEVRQRLALVKEAIRKEREARRALIVGLKEERKNTVLEKSLFVQKMREVSRIQQVSKRETKKTQK